jgi:16S rRNA (guanine1207-N2)-methyltransferase
MTGMAEAAYENVYGAPSADIVAIAPGATQFSPLFPGARDLEQVAPESLDGLAMLAPPGTAERRHELALALRALRPGAPLVALAPKDKGGSRIAGDLRALGLDCEESARKHHRICVALAPGNAAAIETAIEEGRPRLLPDLGLWSQPGVFSWNRVDAGTALLIEHLPPLAGKGADFGCGIGLLARAALRSSKVASLTLVDIDRRAVELARHNVIDPRATFIWGDARDAPGLAGLDFVVMNPPFHEGGVENQSLGQNFIQRAAAMLRTGGTCWLTANRHLPYEAILKPLFRQATPIAEAGGYKIYQARK